MKKYSQVVLVIADGWGYREDPKYNAILEANPEYFNYLWNTYPHTLFEASGEAVGLPKGIIGTSEIGHTTAGIGKIMYTDMVRVFKAIEDGTFNSNPAFKTLIEHVQKNNSTLHVMGVVSPGGVHSHQDHLFAFLRLVKSAGVKKVAIHVITDGRDTPPKSAAEYIKNLEDIIAEIGIGKIVSVCGRYLAMDRDTNWDRTQRALDMLFEGSGEKFDSLTASQAIEKRYSANQTDEFLEPIILDDHETLQKNDGLFFFNFRPDRARQITEKILEKQQALNLCFVTLTQYDKTLNTLVAFPPTVVTTTLAGVLADHNYSQAHIAETEKYAHVTYFFNGGSEKKHEKEEFILINSRKDVPTHDLAPQMRAKEIADATIEQIEKGTNFIVVNLANADMVGHTGKMGPTVEAVKFLDTQLKRIGESILSKEGALFFTADHGNAEFMFDEKTNQPHTAHTLFPVPAILTVPDIKLKDGGTLANVAPTILELFGIEKPTEMTGESLIQE